jgi:hypothetical protein
VPCDCLVFYTWSIKRVIHMSCCIVIDGNKAFMIYYCVSIERCGKGEKGGEMGASLSRYCLGTA